MLRGSVLFWFSSSAASKPRAFVPLEGASVHAVQPTPAFDGSSESELGGWVQPPTARARQGRMRMTCPRLPHAWCRCPGTVHGIVVLLDDAYALSPGGRSELVLSATTPELQVRPRPTHTHRAAAHLHDPAHATPPPLLHPRVRRRCGWRP